MLEFFRSGGVGLYPVLLFGFLAVAAAVLYLLRPERRAGALVVALGATTWACGLLGFATGLLTVLRYLDQVPEPQRLQVLALGVSESLSVPIIALALLVITGLLTAAGAWRAMRTPALTATVG